MASGVFYSGRGRGVGKAPQGGLDDMASYNNSTGNTGMLLTLALFAFAALTVFRFG